MNIKNFDFQIFTYLRSPDFINAIFKVMYTCVYMSEHENVKLVYSIALKFVIHYRPPPEEPY